MSNVQHTDPLTDASRVIDEQAARLETLARAWRAEADYLRNGDHSPLGNAPDVEERYADAAARSLLRYLATEANRIVRIVNQEIPTV